MGVFGGVSFVCGMVFLMMGAWPVFGFFGLDVLLLYLAFRLNYRHAAAYEEVTMTPVALTVRKVSHRGKASEWVLNPLWVRLEKIVHEEFGIEKTAAGVARTPARRRQFPWARRKGEFCRGAGQRAGGGQTRRDPDGAAVIARNRVVCPPGVD